MSVSTYPSEQLTALERQYILLTQNGIPVIAKPFDWLAKKLGFSVDDVLEMTTQFKERGIIGRIAAVPNHYKLGYRYKGMMVWDIDDEQATNLVKRLASYLLLVTAISGIGTFLNGITTYSQWYMENPAKKSKFTGGKSKIC